MAKRRELQLRGLAIREGETKQCQTAYEIFGKYRDDFKAGESIPTREGIVDGRKVVFELNENLSSKPITSRQERTQFDTRVINVTKSPFLVRGRLYLIDKLSLSGITWLYLLIFLLINLFFAFLWSVGENRCCGDSSMNYRELLDFSIQTSTTIGYGTYTPQNAYSNSLVFVLSVIQLILASVYTGLLFLKFVEPTAKIISSDVMTMSNVNRMPCLEVRIGNADGNRNKLLNVNVRFTYAYSIIYNDERGDERTLHQTEELELLISQRDVLDGTVWTLRHVVDETSPLFGLNLSEFPGNSIFEFGIAMEGTQKASGASVFFKETYKVEDIMVGHAFANQVTWDPDAKLLIMDYGSMHKIVPFPVWYPQRESQKVTKQVTQNGTKNVPKRRAQKINQKVAEKMTKTFSPVASDEESGEGPMENISPVAQDTANRGENTEQQISTLSAKNDENVFYVGWNGKKKYPLMTTEPVSC